MNQGPRRRRAEWRPRSGNRRGRWIGRVVRSCPHVTGAGIADPQRAGCRLRRLDRHRSRERARSRPPRRRGAERPGRRGDRRAAGDPLVTGSVVVVVRHPTFRECLVANALAEWPSGCPSITTDCTWNRAMSPSGSSDLTSPTNHSGRRGGAPPTRCCRRSSTVGERRMTTWRRVPTSTPIGLPIQAVDAGLRIPGRGVHTNEAAAARCDPGAIFRGCV
jgi:hypothetical protein